MTCDITLYYCNKDFWPVLRLSRRWCFKSRCYGQWFV